MVRKEQDFSHRTFERNHTGPSTIETIRSFTNTQEKFSLKETSVIVCNTLRSQVLMQLVWWDLTVSHPKRENMQRGYLLSYTKYFTQHKYHSTQPSPKV